MLTLTPPSSPLVSSQAMLLERNLRLVARRSPRSADAIRAAGPAMHVELCVASDGALTGRIEQGAVRRLASAHAPLEEAERFARGVDISQKPAVVVRGFGVGHHIAALAARLKRTGVVFVFEPDVALLRAVMERVDLTGMFAHSNVAILTEAEDAAAMALAVQGVEGLVASGVEMVDHPPSRARLGESAERFGATFTGVIKAVRTQIVTTLVQVETTVRNCVQNVGWYARCPGVLDLKGCTAGSPAVIVSAGPSLRRNIEMLKRPGVAERMVIIAVQTTLKTLLAHGIRPHFVTALDYHEISRRFYEGLTAADVEGVTLVVEPKCSPAILEAFPGAVRCVGDEIQDRLLGQGLLRDMGHIPPGATVAHLAYYLARYLGCDPVVLVGQDLGFTDGQYYAPGAAIHRVWAGELNEFNTLEMLEWQRIARMRSLLRRVEDIHGRPVYTDEQMATYLVQFERDFGRDERAGLTIIDATEGGVRKRHASISTLADALDSFAQRPPHRLPATPRAIAKETAVPAVEKRVTELRQQAAQIERVSRETAGHLKEMLAHQGDGERLNRLIHKAQKNAEKVQGLEAYWHVQFLNQTGQLKRFRADRAIEMEESLSPLQRQRRQIERDLDNVTWLADSAAQLASMLDDGLATLRGGSPVSRDPSPAAPGDVAVIGEQRKRVFACVAADPLIGGLGRERDLLAPFKDGRPVIQHTLERLLGCKQLDGVVLLTPRGEKIELPSALTARIRMAEVDTAPMRARARAVGAARAFARHCWRGGIANLGAYDEAYCPMVLAPVVTERGIDAAAIVGGDWALVEPEIVDSVVARYRERPEGHSITFTQAPPGLGACVIAAHLVQESARVGGVSATIGALLGYQPVAPQADPIAKPVCPSIGAAMRDLMMRCIPDSAKRARILSTWDPASGPAWGGTASDVFADAVETVTMTAAAVEGLRGGRFAGTEIAVTLDARGCGAGRAAAAVAELKGRGAAWVHVRTRLMGGAADAETLAACGAEIVSVDLLADTPETYLALTGVDGHARVREGIERLLELSPVGAGGLPERWIVPRITRCDAVYGEIERFYDRWLVVAGACVIDPLPAAIAGERIEPLPVPELVVRHRMATHVEVCV